MSGFAGLRVVSLESRRAPELAKLIATYGGEAIVAPSMRRPKSCQISVCKGRESPFRNTAFPTLNYSPDCANEAPKLRVSPSINGHCRTTWRRSAPPSRQLLKELWMLLSLRRQFRP